PLTWIPGEISQLEVDPEITWLAAPSVAEHRGSPIPIAHPLQGVRQKEQTEGRLRRSGLSPASDRVGRPGLGLIRQSTQRRAQLVRRKAQGRPQTIAPGVRVGGPSRLDQSTPGRLLGADLVTTNEGPLVQSRGDLDRGRAAGQGRPEVS